VHINAWLKVKTLNFKQNVQHLAPSPTNQHASHVPFASRWWDFF